MKRLNNYQSFNRELADQFSIKGRCLCDGGACDWCLIYYGFVDPKEFDRE